MRIKVDAALQKKSEKDGKTYTRYWLAKKTELYYSTVANLCDGKTDMVSFKVLDKICKALDCQIGDILENGM